MAAEMKGRACFTMEIDPRYVDAATGRWRAFTGQAAVLAGEDRVFNDIAVAPAFSSIPGRISQPA